MVFLIIENIRTVLNIYLLGTVLVLKSVFTLVFKVGSFMKTVPIGIY